MKKSGRVIHKIKYLVSLLVSSLVSLSTLASFFISSPISANLDGRTAPIYLDAPYSFANGEWARGSVFFRKGFDLPVGGTIYLGIDGGFVNGPINLKGGTLTLEKHLTLKNKATIVAPGFMRGTNGVPESVVVKYECRGLWAGTGTVKIITTGMNFQAISDSAAMDNGNVTIDVREAGWIYFLGGRVIFRNWLTNEANPFRMWFFNADVIATNDFSTFNSAQIFFEGQVSLTALHPLALKNVYLQGSTKMILYPGGLLSLNQLSIAYKGTRFEMRQSSLDFVSTSTALLRMITPYIHNLQGSLVVDGKCHLSSSTNNTLIFDKYAQLELLAGAQLTIQEGTHLLIE